MPCRNLRLNYLLFLIFLLLVSAVHPAAAADTDFQKAIQNFDTYAGKQMKADRIPGLSIGFIKNGFLWAKGYGYADLENRVTAKPESAYRLASITKTLTAVAVLQQVEAGKIDLNAEVQSFVPYFPRKKWPVKVGQLLGHLGGISHYKSYDQEGHFKQHMDTREALAVFQDFDLVAEPGTIYNYSSYGYNLLGAVIEGATGLSYGKYLQDYILNPLGMDATRLDNPDDLIPNRVRGYRLIDGEIKNSEFIDISSRFAGGGTRSTVIDLLKYAQGICDGKLLKPETLQMMFTSMATREGQATGYGSGWRVEPFRGHFVVSHGGSQAETRTYLAIFPTENFAVAVGSNLEGSNPSQYARRLAEIVLDQDLSTIAYARDLMEQVIYNVCDQIFSYGLSRYDYFGDILLSDKKALDQAFSYFNHNTSKYLFKKSLPDTLKKLKNGIHPVSGKAFVLVGAYMAAVLEKAYGKARLLNYSKTGCLNFFSDYIALQNPRRLNRYLSDFVNEWQKDWQRTYAEPAQRPRISLETDIKKLAQKLQEKFNGAGLYPDYSSELLSLAESLLQKNDQNKSFSILDLSAKLYPDSPAVLRAQAFACLYTGDYKRVRSLYQKSFRLEPAGIGHFLSRAAFLQRKNRVPALIRLADIAAEFYPESADLHQGIGRLLEEIEQNNAALRYYKRALKLDPTLEDIKPKVTLWEKRRRHKK